MLYRYKIFARVIIDLIKKIITESFLKHNITGSLIKIVRTFFPSLPILKKP